MKQSILTTDNFDIGWIHKDAKCWVYFPLRQQGQIFIRATIHKIVPLNFNKGNSNVKGILDNGIQFQTKANLLEKCRDSKSIEKDLIEMDIINGAEVLNQLKKRFEQKKIHTYLWNSLIIANPFYFIDKNYGQAMLKDYYQSIYLRQDLSLTHMQPHIYAFLFNILKQVKYSSLAQVLSISGQSGSGKTQTNKQCLKAISYCCQKQKLKSQKQLSDHNLQLKILQCDPILQAFGNAKTVKNDNSSRFGKLINIKIDPQSMSIKHSAIKNYFLQKSRIISQAPGQRSFHIFYLFLKFFTDQDKAAYKLKSKLGVLKIQDFNYISHKNNPSNSNISISEKQMWNGLLDAFRNLQFNKQQINQIWSILSSVLLLGNIHFDGALQNQNDPCEILNTQIVANISYLLKISKQQLSLGLIFNKKIIAGQQMHIPLTAKQCQQGRDSMTKAIYEGLFLWIVQELNRKVNNLKNQSQLNHCKQIKLLDIYGFQVFQKNSFQQLCVNFTNQKIHQIYLEQVFIHEKKILKAEGLQLSIPNLNFTDNFKIIELLQTSTKSIYNLLDESCTYNVKDTDFLSNIRKSHESHEHFPLSNSTNIRNSFIIKHTPGQIEYLVEGFRDKNKDLLREGIVHKFAQSQLLILKCIFEQKSTNVKHEPNKKYLGTKIRKQVKELIAEMSSNSNLHFVRCIKPNQQKKAFGFVDRVCFNQIKYLGILDTIQMRKESYHVRINYKDFYRQFGILDNNIDQLISIQSGNKSQSECKQLAMKLLVSNKFTNHKLQYLIGKQKIFMKMSTKNFLDLLLRQKASRFQYASSVIQAFYRLSKHRKLARVYKKNVPKIQNAVRKYLTICKLSKKKKAVMIIEAYWNKYSVQFFNKKRRNYLIVVQKHIKKAIEMQKLKYKLKAMLFIKNFIKSALRTQNQIKYISQFTQVKEIFNNQIYQSIWSQIEGVYKQKVKSYLKTFATRKINRIPLYQSQKTALYKQNLSRIITLNLYLRGFVQSSKFSSHIQSIKKVQNYIRMSKLRKKYARLKYKTTKIQKAWRNYYQFKQQSIYSTKEYFQHQTKDQKQHIQKILYRKDESQNRYQESQNNIQHVLSCQQKIKRQKIGLFYYLLDFQMICDLKHIYPEQSWVNNYCTLFKQSIERGTPIQYLDVSDTHTICTTINKIYQWGEIREQSFGRTQIKFQNIPTPNNRVLKVKACNGFTIIETQQPQQLLVMGDQKKYEQSSIKQWSTLKQSYVLLNGVVLTLKDNSLTKILISQKISSLSCGWSHVICKTSLKRVYTWGQNKMGQLGHGNFYRSLQPKSIQFISKNKLNVAQVGATAFGSVVLDTNSKLWWFGSNGSIRNQPLPKQAFIPLKSDYIDNNRKYAIVRIIPRWSRSISLIGVTIAIYDGAFKPTQTAIRKKCLQTLMVKWSQDVQTINPPYIATISGYFLEKHMFFKKPQKKTQSEQNLKYEQIKNKLLNEYKMMEHAQRKLLTMIKTQRNKESWSLSARDYSNEKV